MRRTPVSLWETKGWQLQRGGGRGERGREGVIGFTPIRPFTSLCIYLSKQTVVAAAGQLNECQEQTMSPHTTGYWNTTGRVVYQACY